MAEGPTLYGHGGSKKKVLQLSLALGWSSFLAGCVVPIVQPAGKTDLSLTGLPEGAEKVEVVAEDGVVLRGVFVPAGQNAPVILHLLPSQSSVTTGLGGMMGSLDLDAFLCALCERGYASLAFDYRGVGASGGERDPERIPDDAWAMWLEAVRRAQGQQNLVILRGGSLGTLAVASILERGVAARGAVLIAPIRAETIAGHAARKREGAILGTVISIFLTRPMDVDLVSTLGTTSTPALVLLPETDDLLPPEEMNLVAQAATQGGKRVHCLEGDHLHLVLECYGYEIDVSNGIEVRRTGRVLQEEREFLERIGSASTTAD